MSCHLPDLQLVLNSAGQRFHSVPVLEPEGGQGFESPRLHFILISVGRRLRGLGIRRGL